MGNFMGVKTESSLVFVAVEEVFSFLLRVGGMMPLVRFCVGPALWLSGFSCGEVVRERI